MGDIDFRKLALDAWAQGLRIEWLWLRYALKTGRPPLVIQGPLHVALMSTGRAIARLREAP